MQSDPDQSEQRETIEDDLPAYDKELYERKEDGWEQIGQGCYHKNIGPAE